MKPEEQVSIGKLATIPTIFIVLFIANEGVVWPIHFFPLKMAITVVLLAGYAFLLSRNLLNASLGILSFITVDMIAVSFGDPLLLALGLLALFLLYQGIIGIYRMKSKQMNIKQQAVVWFWVAAAFIMGFCPPWSVAQDNGTQITRYGPLWYPPHPDVLMMDGVGLAPGILSIQCLIITVISCTLVYILRDKKTEKTS
ncbi:MAG: hypothetical protein ACYS1A_14405 [Planctomycetota bacterium]|jgi:hypothetical protein